MKGKKICADIMLSLLLITDGCSKGDMVSYYDSIVNTDEVTKKEEKIEKNVESELNNGSFDFMATIDNPAFLEEIEKTVVVNEGELLEEAGWIEKDVIYRVAIEREEAASNEYSHLRDYIYVKNKDGIKEIEVTYAEKSDMNGERYVWSNCSFDVVYEDVTFDGNKDILVFLGEAGNSSILTYCAYVYSDGEYVYKKSFENIGNYKVNNEKKVIEGWYTGEAHNDHYIYEYVDDDFVFKSVDIFEYDFDKDKYVYEKTIYDLSELIGN